MNNFLKNKNKKYQTKFKSWMTKDCAGKDPECKYSLETIDKPIRESGNKKKLKQFKKDMSGIAEMSYLNKYL